MRVLLILFCVLAAGCDWFDYTVLMSDIKNREVMCVKNEGVYAFDLADVEESVKPVSRVRCNDGATFVIQYDEFKKVVAGAH
jgi:hypothetical protein